MACFLTPRHESLLEDKLIRSADHPIEPRGHFRRDFVPSESRTVKGISGGSNAELVILS